jgi:hypothetical protein
MKKSILFALFWLVSLIAHSQTIGFEKEPYIFFQNKIVQSTITSEIEKVIIQWQLTAYPNDPCELMLGTAPFTGPVLLANYNWTDDLWYVELDFDYYLEYDQKYYYQAFIMDDDIPIAGKTGSFVTPPLPESNSTVFYGYGDTRGSSTSPPAYHDPVCEAIMDEAFTSTDDQTLLIHTGDWNYNDDETKWTQDYFNLTHSNSLELKANLPIMGARGNHEITGTNYKKYWPYSYAGATTGFCYSFDYGPIHFCIIDLKDEDAILDQNKKNWIQNDLAGTQKKWKIAVFHSPIYSNGGHDNNEYEQSYLQNLFVNQGVQLVLCGHNHYYARWMVNGIHHLTLGGGGAPIYTPQTGIGELEAASIYHFGKFEIDDKLARISIIDKDGNHFEDFAVPQSTLICDNQNVIWDNDMIYCDDVRICSGSSLTISTEVKFAAGSKIIVERGGKLILDDATLTSAFEDEQWLGIEVWGNSLASQNPISQGWVVSENGTTIENSQMGIYTNRPDPVSEGWTPNYTGGIVQVSETEFVNNTIAAQFFSYNYTSVSYFVDCNFEVNNGYFGASDPENYVEVAGISGLDFNYCSFVNGTNIDQQFTGIESVNSTVYFEGDCISGTPCNEWDNGTFENLEYGVYATATTSTRKVDIRHTTFTDNYRGIYISGMTAPRITSCEFNLNVTEANDGYGLYLDESTDYWVEDNVFRKSSSYVQPRCGMGIIVNESGDDPNEIYLNDFNSVEHAIKAQNINRNGKNEEGLVIRCNEYINTDKDEIIVHNYIFGNSGLGVAADQGSNTLYIEDMAGNIFYYETTTTDYDDLDNSANHFDYYYSTYTSNNNVEPLDFTTATIDKIGKSTYDIWTREDACESGIYTGGGGGEEERSSMVEAQSEIEETEAILALMIDGGDTEALDNDVETSIPPEAVQVYNELLSESPNLSETVVESSIEKEDVLPNAMVRDVMVANPHTAKSSTLMAMLDERFDPMPEYMKAQILAGRSIQTLKQELESKLAGYKLKKAKAMNGLVRYYLEELGDPVAASDSLVALFSSDNTLESSYKLAWVYMDRGDFQAGTNIINNIPASYSLTDDQVLDHNNLASIYGMLSGLYQNGDNLEALTGNQLSQLQLIASSEKQSQARAYARNILLALDAIEYQEPILHPDILKSTEIDEQYKELMEVMPPKILEAYPNPSSNYIVIEYNLDMDRSATIEITDINGKPVKTIVTDGKQDQITLVTEKWETGLYIATLEIDGKSVESTKFTVIK